MSCIFICGWWVAVVLRATVEVVLRPVVGGWSVGGRKFDGGRRLGSGRRIVGARRLVVAGDSLGVVVVSVVVVDLEMAVEVEVEGGGDGG
ncbi:hypothetical protein Hanom_Chr05g00450341 [Helianthus anomalus]